jgi:hypothetical protein
MADIDKMFGKITSTLVCVMLLSARVLLFDKITVSS